MVLSGRLISSVFLCAFFRIGSRLHDERDPLRLGVRTRRRVHLPRGADAPVPGHGLPQTVLRVRPHHRSVAVPVST